MLTVLAKDIFIHADVVGLIPNIAVHWEQIVSGSKN